jgi:hypothetical protein
MLKSITLAILLMLPAPAFAYDGATATVQSCLTVLGFAPGPIDGRRGPRAAAALDAYLWSRYGPNYRAVDSRERTRQFMRECNTALRSRQGLSALPLGRD